MGDGFDDLLGDESPHERTQGREVALACHGKPLHIGLGVFLDLFVVDFLKQLEEFLSIFEVPGLWGLLILGFVVVEGDEAHVDKFVLVHLHKVVEGEVLIDG